MIVSVRSSVMKYTSVRCKHSNSTGLQCVVVVSVVGVTIVER
jgi:hypothetical protein